MCSCFYCLPIRRHRIHLLFVGWLVGRLAVKVYGDSFEKFVIYVDGCAAAAHHAGLEEGSRTSRRGMLLMI